MITTANLFARGSRRGPELDIALNEAWRALSQGRGSEADFELVMNDLAEVSEYYYVAPTGTSGEDLIRREGARAIFARILFLLDVPVSKLAEWRKAALIELEITNEEGER